MDKRKKKLIRVSTVPMSLNIFLRGQLTMLNEHYDVIAVSSPDMELNELSQREGVRTIAVPMERHISLMKDLKSLIMMIKVFRTEKPFIVHSMTPKAGLISMLAAWVCRVPVRMHTYTGLVFPTAKGLSQKILIFTDRILCFCANYINPEGQGVAKDLKNYGITNKPLHIIGQGNVRGIDINYWTRNSEGDNAFNEISRSSLGIDEDDFVFLFVGRLVKSKGINELVEAFGKLQNEKKNSKFKLLLVGSFENELDPLEQRTIDELEKNDSIIAVGSKKDVRPYYAISDLFVFPSYREGFPNTVLEAGAMGLPQIVTDINGNNEIIKDGLNGVIIQAPIKSSRKRKDDGSLMIGPSHHEFANRYNEKAVMSDDSGDFSSPMANALYKSMNWFIEHPAERQRMANNARRMVVDRFEQKKLWQQLLDVYDGFK